MSLTVPSERPPAGRWPFTGREEQTGQITSLLRAGRARGVVLAGGPGVGRSRLAAEAARAFGPVHRVVGTRCGAALPYSAFAGLLPGGPQADPAGGPAVVLRGTGQERPVLVVDDAHLLDQGSAALVHRLAVRRDVRLVVTVRDGEPAPDAVVALWKDDLLRRLEVPPLGPDDLARVLESALGGHVEARAVRRLAAIGGGDLRMIRELVMAGTLTRRAELWGWSGRLPVNGCVRELLSSRLGELDAGEWDALTYLAFGAPRTPGTLAGLAGSHTVERLEDKGLLTCYGGAPYAEVIRATCGPVRTARVSRTLAGLAGLAAETAPPVGDGMRATAEEMLRAVVWRLDGGLPVRPETLTGACRAALAAHDVPLAVRLGRAAVDAGHGPAGTAALATALARRDPRVPGDVPPLSAEHERITAAILAGDLTAEPLAGADTGWDIAGAAHCGQLARLHRLRGAAGHALAAARDGAWRLPGGKAAFAGLCFGEVAHAAALLGDAGTARRALAEAADRTLPAFGAYDVSAVLAAPWVDAATGDQAGAVRRALAGAERAGTAEVVLFSLHDAVRLGAACEAAGALERLAGDHVRPAGSLAGLFARHARAGANDDGVALREVAREFEALGLRLYAAEAQAQAARAFRRAGEHRQAKAAAASGWVLGRHCEGARTPALSELAAPELTLRQLEIARLAASGLSNRAIAERLTVSIRTVANHLCGAYERLGVNDRAGLARLLAGFDRRAA